MPGKCALYVDGFNFYYGVTNHFRADRERRGYSLSGLCWCDFRALVERHHLPTGSQLGPIRYFTAPVTEAVEASPRPGEHDRYELWIRAVRHVPGLEVVSGFHRKTTKAGDAGRVREEKQTDVNMAVELLLDGLAGRYDTAYVLSGDTDQIPAIIAATLRLPTAKHVVVLLPPSQDEDDYKKRFCASNHDTIQRSMRGDTGPMHFMSLNQLLVKPLTENVLANSLLAYEHDDVSCPEYWRLHGAYLENNCKSAWRPDRKRAVAAR